MLLELLAIRLAHAIGQTVIEVADRLAAVLVVLVGLDGNASKRGVRRNVVRLAQHAVACGETALEQLAQLNLAARGGQRVEVQVVDMDVAFAVSARVAGIQNAHLVELLRGFGAILQHGAHGGVGVDVGVFALHVGVRCLGERDVLQRLD